MIPGLNGEDVEPFGSETVTAVVGRTVHILQPYIEYKDPMYDFAAIILPNDDLGSKSGSF